MSWSDKLAGMRTDLRELHKLIPETVQAFGALGKTAKSGQVLDTKTIELIALAISINERCEPCITFHTDALVELGATRDEIADVLAMCIQMGGGPSYMYAGKALACYDEYLARRGTTAE